MTKRKPTCLAALALAACSSLLPAQNASAADSITWAAAITAPRGCGQSASGKADPRTAIQTVVDLYNARASSCAGPVPWNLTSVAPTTFDDGSQTYLAAGTVVEANGLVLTITARGTCAVTCTGPSSPPAASVPAWDNEPMMYQAVGVFLSVGLFFHGFRAAL